MIQSTTEDTSPRRASLLPILLVLAGCGGGAAAELPGPTPEPPDEPTEEESYRGVPGFDTRNYPGEGVMETWRQESPYRWVGYYLPAPCYTGTTWQGKRPSLERQGWGLAVLFVGEQDWPSADPAEDAVAADQPPRCTSSNLTAERGVADARAAEAAAGGEGFPAGTVIYLDVERVEQVSDELAEYVGAWTGALLDGGRYTPGLYAHARNAESLLETMTAEFRDRDRADAPRLWVASTGGFSLRRGPAESGFPAEIWQGALDVEETWGGYTLRIDANVAAREDPSG